MIARIALTAVSLALLANAANAQTSLGALRLNNGGAVADNAAWAYAVDACGAAYQVSPPSAILDEESANNSAQAAADLGPWDNCNAQASESVITAARVTPARYATVYAPEVTAAVGHQVSANAVAPSGYALAGGVGYSFGQANAAGNYLINDGGATAPCINGFIDIIVTAQTQGTGAGVDPAVNVTVGVLNVATVPGGYGVTFDGNLVYTIATPPAGNVNVILQLVDCGYQQPIPLNAWGGTGFLYGTGAAAPPGGQALASISLLAWFEAEDFGANPPDSPQVILQHRDEHGDPDGDPIHVDLGGDDPPGGY